MLRFQLLPAETRFYDWFEKGTANLLQSARLLKDLVDNYDHTDSKLQHITETERVGDAIVHEIHDLLLKTLITPIDQEEARNLSHAIDNVVDTIEQAAIQMRLYKVEKCSTETRQLADLIVKCAAQIDAAMPLLREQKKFGQIQEHIIEVHRLENEADTVYRHALEQLVEHSRNDWFEFVRWKEIYGLLEDATDLCEDIADVLQTVVMKHG